MIRCDMVCAGVQGAFVFFLEMASPRFSGKICCDEGRKRWSSFLFPFRVFSESHVYLGDECLFPNRLCVDRGPRGEGGWLGLGGAGGGKGGGGLFVHVRRPETDVVLRETVTVPEYGCSTLPPPESLSRLSGTARTQGRCFSSRFVESGHRIKILVPPGPQ